MSRLRPFLWTLVVTAFPGGAIAQRPAPWHPSGWVSVQVDEPSDMVIVPGSSPVRAYVVSDDGYVAVIRADGTVVKRSEQIAFDLEGVLLHGAELLVVDERTRRILWVDTTDLKVTRLLTFPYAGGRNKGYEAILWNPVKERFALITERDPVRITELDTTFRIVNEIDFDRSVRDISSATWHNGYPWLLSDMDRELLKCDPHDLHVLERWTLPVLNPEGLAFGPDGTLFILSDDLQRLYTFPSQSANP